MPVSRVAVMRLSALGDLVLMLPLIQRLVAAGIELDWIIGRSFAPLFRGIPGVRLIEIDKPRTLSDYRALYQQLRRPEYQVLLATQANLRVNLLYPAIRAPHRIGFDLARARDGQRWFVNDRIEARTNHLCDGFLQFAEQLGLPEQPLVWQLPLDPAAVDWAAQQLPGSNWLAINPAASKAERNWPVERYVALIQKLRAQGKWRLLLTGGPGALEVELAGQIQAALPSGTVVNYVGKTSLPQLVALLAQVRALIAPDTGPVHLATALGKPVIGLYAVAPAWLTGPYRQTDWVIDRFDQAVARFLHRDPAQVPMGTRVHDPRAMSLIEVDEVWQKLLLLN